MPADPTSPPHRRLTQNVILALSTVLLIGAMAEGLARLIETRRPALPPIADYITRWGEGESDFYTIKSSATGWPPWEDYNSEGVRDREHAVEKPPGVRRVVCLGDSVTLGFGLPPEDAYPQLLQDHLDALGEPIEVFNLALFGWATRQERLAYERIARKYRPDVVLLGVCLNDVAELQNDLARPPRLLTVPYQHSALVRWAVGAHRREIRTIEELFEAREAPRVRSGFRRMFADLEALHRDVRRDGASLAVLVLPFRGQMGQRAPAPSAQAEIAAFCRERGIPVLDLLPALREVGDAAFLDHVHLTAPGMRRVAEAVAESGLIPDASGATRAEASVSAGVRPDLPALLAALRAPEDARRAAAARAMGNAGAQPELCVPALGRALEDESAAVRAGAAWALGGFQAAASPTLSQLVAAAADRDPLVRAGAVRAIGKIGPGARSVAGLALVRRLSDSDPNVRRRAGEALVRVGAECEGCLAPLIEILAEPGSPGRAAAAGALGGIGPSASPAVAALVGALGDERPDVRGRAAWALGRIGPEARDAVNPLVALIDDPAVGWQAIDALGGIGASAASAAPPLTRALHSGSGNVRWRAAQAVGRIGPAAGAAAADLVVDLRDPEENVRLAAAKALGRIEPEPKIVLTGLAQALTDADSRVRAEVARDLARLGARAHHQLPALIAATRDPDALVRAAAARALPRLGPSPEAQARLADLARSDPDEKVRAEARRALHREASAAH